MEAPVAKLALHAFAAKTDGREEVAFLGEDFGALVDDVLRQLVGEDDGDVAGEAVAVNVLAVLLGDKLNSVPEFFDENLQQLVAALFPVCLNLGLTCTAGEGGAGVHTLDEQSDGVGVGGGEAALEGGGIVPAGLVGVVDGDEIVAAACGSEGGPEVGPALELGQQAFCHFLGDEVLAAEAGYQIEGAALQGSLHLLVAHGTGSNGAGQSTAYGSLIKEHGLDKAECLNGIVQECHAVVGQLPGHCAGQSIVVHHDHGGLHETLVAHDVAPGNVDSVLNELAVLLERQVLVVLVEIVEAVDVSLTDIVEGGIAFGSNETVEIGVSCGFEGAVLVGEEGDLKASILAGFVIVLGLDFDTALEGDEAHIAVLAEETLKAAVLKAGNTLQSSRTAALAVGVEDKTNGCAAETSYAEEIIVCESDIGVNLRLDNAQAAYVTVVVITGGLAVLEQLNVETHVGHVGHFARVEGGELQAALEVIFSEIVVAARNGIVNAAQIALFVGMEVNHRLPSFQLAAPQTRSRVSA